MIADPLDRREFVLGSARMALACSLLTLSAEGCGLASPTGPLSFSAFNLELNDPRNAALKEVGGAVKVPLKGQKPLIVSRVDPSTYAAFSSRCPHRGCEVPLPDSRGISTCPCHGAQFDIAGKVRRGPARRDLRRAQVTREGELLAIMPPDPASK